MEEKTIEPQDALFQYRSITPTPLTNELPKQELTVLVDSIRSKAKIKMDAPSSMMMSYMNENTSPVFDSFINRKIKTKDYTINQEDVYKEIGGELIAKQPDYIKGIDNNERAAQNQSTSDKWINGLTKASLNFGTTVVGNTVGLVGGLANGIAQGSINAIFDNSFTNYLADLNEKVDYKLANYVSKDEQDDNFFESMGNANFWAKDVAGAFSFTLGTAVSEAIWAAATGGASIAAKMALSGAKVAGAARAAKLALKAETYAAGLSGAKKILASATQKMISGNIDNVLGAGVSASMVGKRINTIRFLGTTSGNEAGIEALHYKREARENFYDNFERLNGRAPSTDDINEFEDKLGNSANAVFATNMAILMPSNLAMFGSAFNIASPFKGMAKSFNKTAFGIGTELVEEGGEKIYKGIVASGKQKVARVAFAAGKPILTEGLWEEGLQGVTTKTAKNWIESTFDPKYNNQTMSLADATYKAFGEQYGTKEGWKEIGIGGIVGGVSSVVSGRGKFQEVRDFEREQEYQDKFVAEGMNKYGDNTTQATRNIAHQFMFDARVKEATERQIKAGKDGDDIGFALANQDKLVSEIQFRASMGEDTKELISKYETALNAMPKEDFIEQGITDIESYKEAAMNGYKSLINAHEKASKFADAIIGDTGIMGIDSKTMETRQLKDGLTRAIVSGQLANKAMDSILQDMGSIIGNDTMKALKIKEELSVKGKDIEQKIIGLNKSIEQAENETVILSDELQKLQISKDEEGRAERLAKVQGKLTENLAKTAELKSQRGEFAKDFTQESKRRRGVQSAAKGIGESNLLSDFITGEDLANLDKNLKKIEDTIKSYEGVNHEVYYDLLESKRQYGLARDRFMGYQDAIDGIVSGNFKPNYAKVSPFWQKIFMQNQGIDDFSKTYLENILENYKKSNSRLGVDDLTGSLGISDNDYRIFQETGDVSDEIKQEIAEKIKNKEPLSTRAKEIYDANYDEINNLNKVKPNPNKPDLSPEASIDKEIEALEKEKAELEKQLVVENEESDSKEKADIERRRQEELKPYDERDANSLEAIMPNNPNHPTFKVGMKFNQGMNIIVKERLAADNYDGREDAYEAITAIISPAEFGKNGKMTKAAEVKVTLFNTKEEADKAIQEKYENVQSKVGQKQKEINAKYDAELKNNTTSQTTTTQPQNNNKEVQQKIDELNKQIQELRNKNRGTLTEAEKVKEDAEAIMDRDFKLIPLNIDELLKGRPKKGEIERYRELYKKRETLDLFESKEFEELQPRMQKWFTAESLPSIEGMSLAEVVEYLVQLDTLAEVENTLTEVPYEALLNKEDAVELVNENILQNMAGSATTKIVEDGTTSKIFFSGLNVRTIIDRLIENGITQAEIKVVVKDKNGKESLVKKDLTDALLKEHTEKLTVGTEFLIGNTKIVIGARGNIVMDLAQYNKVKDVINVHHYNAQTGSWSWTDAYEEVEGVDKVKIKSTYNANTVSDKIYDAKTGDDVEFYVDMNTDYNRGLISQVIPLDSKKKEKLEKEIQDLKNTLTDNKKETDALVDEFARESNDGVLNYEKDDLNGQEVIVYQTIQPDSWGGKGSSFKKTWDSLIFQQGTFAHVKILMTTEQKEFYAENKKSDFAVNLRKLAIKSRNEYSVVLIDIRNKDVRANSHNAYTNKIIEVKQKELNSIRESQKNEITEDLKKDIEKNLEITAIRNGTPISTMKATGDKVTNDNFMLVRKRYVDEFIRILEKEQALATLPKKIDLKIEAPISEIFLGTPDFILDENNKPKELPITEAGLQRWTEKTPEGFITQGYVQDKEIVLADKKVNVENLTRLYVSNLAKKNPGMKIPVVLLQKGEHLFVFPIKLIQTPSSQEGEFQTILESSDNFNEIRRDINNLLISLGTNTRLTSESQIEAIREELVNYKTTITADDLVDEKYDKMNLITDAEIPIDLENTLISSPKITVDFSKAIFGAKTENETSARNIRQELVKDLLEIEKIVNSSPDLKDETRFVEAFSNNAVKDKGSDIMNRSDVNFIMKAFFNESGKIAINENDKAVIAIGKDKLLAFRKKLENLAWHEDQIKVHNDKEAIDKTKCKK